MTNEKVFQMDFGKVYELLLNKAVTKGRTQTEVDEVIFWLTGHNTESLEKALTSSVCYGDFFRNAPTPNPNRTLAESRRTKLLDLAVHVIPLHSFLASIWVSVLSFYQMAAFG